MKKSYVLFLMIIILVSALFVSCEVSTELDHNVLVEASVGLSSSKAITVEAASGITNFYEVTIEPLWTSVEDDDPISYGLFTKGSGATSAPLTTSKASFNIGFVSQGFWRVHVLAKNGNGEDAKVIYEGSSDICFTSNSTTGSIVLHECRSSEVNVRVSGITVPVLSADQTGYSVVVKLDGDDNKKLELTPGGDGSYTVITGYKAVTSGTYASGTYYSKTQTGVAVEDVAENSSVEGLYTYDVDNKVYVAAEGIGASGTTYYRVSENYSQVSLSAGDNLVGLYEQVIAKTTQTYVNSSYLTVTTGSHTYSVTYEKGGNVLGGTSGVFFCVPDVNIEISGWIDPSAFVGTTANIVTSGSASGPADEVAGTITCTGHAFDQDNSLELAKANAENLVLTATAAGQGMSVTWFVDGDMLNVHGSMFVGPNDDKHSVSRYSGSVDNNVLTLTISVEGDHEITCEVEDSEGNVVNESTSTICVR